MQLEIKFKSIAVRMVFQHISYSCGYSLHGGDFLFGDLQQHLHRADETLANDLTYEFNSLSNSSKTAFKENAVELAAALPTKTSLRCRL